MQKAKEKRLTTRCDVKQIHSRSERFYTTAWTWSSVSQSGNVSIFRCMDFHSRIRRDINMTINHIYSQPYIVKYRTSFSCKQNHRSSLCWKPVTSQGEELCSKYRSALICSNIQMWWSREGWWEATNQKALTEFNSVEIKRRSWEYEDTTDFTLLQKNKHAVYVQWNHMWFSSHPGGIHYRN